MAVERVQPTRGGYVVVCLPCKHRSKVFAKKSQANGAWANHRCTQKHRRALMLRSLR